MKDSIMTNCPKTLIAATLAVIGGKETGKPTTGKCNELSLFVYNKGNEVGFTNEVLELADVRSMMTSQMNKKAGQRMSIADICLRVVNMANIMADQGCISFTTKVMTI